MRGVHRRQRRHFISDELTVEAVFYWLGFVGEAVTHLL
jgi:hypothetical protein